jgi:hypothetical protein
MAPMQFLGSCRVHVSGSMQGIPATGLDGCQEDLGIPNACQDTTLVTLGRMKINHRAGAVSGIVESRHQWPFCGVLEDDIAKRPAEFNDAMQCNASLREGLLTAVCNHARYRTMIVAVSTLKRRYRTFVWETSMGYQGPSNAV